VRGGRRDKTAGPCAAFSQNLNTGGGGQGVSLFITSMDHKYQSGAGDVGTSEQ
jgi:hypothetical protein